MRNNQPRGAQHYCAKLSEIEVISIRFWLKAGVTQTKIAEAFGVSYCTIHDIKIGRTWKHIEERDDEE